MRCIPSGACLPCLLLLISSCRALSGVAHEPGVQRRGSSGSSSGFKPSSPSHIEGKTPAHGNPSVRLFGVTVTPGHKPVVSPHSSQSINSATPHPDHPAKIRPGPLANHPNPHFEGTREQAGNLEHLVAGLQPAAPPRTFGPARRRGRPSGSRNIPKAEKASQALRRKPAQNAKGARWWSTPGGTPNVSHGTSGRYEAQRKYRQKQKLKAAGNPLDEHPAKHQHNPPGGPGSPGAGSHAVSKRRLEQ